MVSLNEPRFRCCCGSSNVKTGSWIIAGFHAAWILITFIGLIIIAVAATREYEGASLSVPRLIQWIVEAIAVIALFVGLWLEKGWLLIPYLVILALNIIFIYIGIALLWLFQIYYIFAKRDSDIRKWGEEAFGTQSVWPVVLITAAITIALLVLAFFLKWIFSIIYRTRNYFNEKDDEVREKAARDAEIEKKLTAAPQLEFFPNDVVREKTVSPPPGYSTAPRSVPAADYYSPHNFDVREARGGFTDRIRPESPRGFGYREAETYVERPRSTYDERPHSPRGFGDRSYSPRRDY